MQGVRGRAQKIGEIGFPIFSHCPEGLGRRMTGPPIWPGEISQTSACEVLGSCATHQIRLT